MDYTLQVKGRLLSLQEPLVMGILNVTPASFFAGSRAQTEQEIGERARRMVSEGAAIIDVGACSTRPGSVAVSQEEEMARLRQALGVLRREQPLSVISVDTFRPDVARMAVEEYGADIVNDVGLYDLAEEDKMLRTVSNLQVPYIIMSSQPTLHDTLMFFARRVQRLSDMGQKDIILDPGFGFGKTLEQNYALLAELEKLQVMELPVLVGISRKSMIYKLLETNPEASLNGTTVLNTVALMKGASILRVHDVREAVECVRMAAALTSNPNLRTSNLPS